MRMHELSQIMGIVFFGRFASPKPFPLSLQTDKRDRFEESAVFVHSVLIDGFTLLSAQFVFLVHFLLLGLCDNEATYGLA